MTNKKERERVIKEFNLTRQRAELNALSKTSLQRPLTDKELDHYKTLFYKTYVEPTDTPTKILKGIYFR